MKGFFTVILIFVVSAVYAQETCTLLTSGDIKNASSGSATWSCTGASSNPIDMVVNAGNQVIIPAGLTLTITGNQTWESNVTLKQETSAGAADGGQVVFEKKLSLGSVTNCGFTFDMETGSNITDSGGGADRLIICEQTIIGNGTAVIDWPTDGSGFSGPLVIDDTGDALPIELIYFNAKVINKKVDLTWATASEENFNYFSIERSFDGQDFVEITQVKGNGNSYDRIDYSYTDNFPGIGRSYYRLRSIDFDGYTEIFDYIMVNVEEDKLQANVFPNPVTNGVVNIQLNFDLEQEAQVLIYNNMGLVRLDMTIDSWLSSKDVSNLSSGSYLIKIITSNGIFVKRILIK